MSGLPFDWNDLQHFLAAARAGTLSGAARRLGVDHATISRRLAALEQALGAKLFERNPRGYNLTQTGERLLASAEAIETEALRAERQVAGEGQRVSGTVRISTLEAFGNFFLAPLLPRLAQENPKLHLELVSIQQIVALSRREADIVITLKKPDGDRPRLSRRGGAGLAAPVGMFELARADGGGRVRVRLGRASRLRRGSPSEIDSRAARPSVADAHLLDRRACRSGGYRARAHRPTVHRRAHRRRTPAIRGLSGLGEPVRRRRRESEAAAVQGADVQFAAANI